MQVSFYLKPVELYQILKLIGIYMVDTKIKQDGSNRIKISNSTIDSRIEHKRLTITMLIDDIELQQQLLKIKNTFANIEIKTKDGVTL